MLEYHATLRRRAGNGLAVHLQLAAAGHQVPGQGAEQRRLATTRGAEDADKLARLYGKVQALHRLERVAAVPQVYRQAMPFDTPWRKLKAVHHPALRVRYQGVASSPMRLTRALLPMPSTPISSMPTMMSG